VIGLPSLQAMDGAQGARIWMASERRTCAADSIGWRNVCKWSLERTHKAVICLCSVRAAVIFKIPRGEQGARSVELRTSEPAMILDGIDVSKLKRVPRYQRAIHRSRAAPTFHGTRYASRPQRKILISQCQLISMRRAELSCRALNYRQSLTQAEPVQGKGSKLLSTRAPESVPSLVTRMIYSVSVCVAARTGSILGARAFSISRSSPAMSNCAVTPV
jgi:hypothetical protein